MQNFNSKYILGQIEKNDVHIWEDYKLKLSKQIKLIIIKLFVLLAILRTYR